MTVTPNKSPLMHIISPVLIFVNKPGKRIFRVLSKDKALFYTQNQKGCNSILADDGRNWIEETVKKECMTSKKRQAQSVLVVFGNVEPLRYSRRRRISQKGGSDCEQL